MADERLEPRNFLLSPPAAVNPRAEAEARLGGRYEARVLEPSPPTNDEPPFFADDPVARGEVRDGRMVVSPVPGGDLLWSELAATDEGLAAWCSERWLAAYPRLQAAPGELVATRLELHRLAESEISPARQRVNGKIGLRYTRGGFGTPFFGEDQQLRVQGADLVEQRGDQEVSRRGLEVDLQAARFLGDWYGFAASVLETLRARPARDAEASRVQLWPEHFDMSVELGAEAAGARAGYGLSPGDEQHPEPYAYVAPWQPPAAGELWNAEGFTGAELPYAELLRASDQREAVLDFFGTRLDALTA